MGRWTDFFGVEAGNIKTASVGAAALAENSVGPSEIQSGAVDSDELADGAVTADKLAPGVTGSKSIYFDPDASDDTANGLSPSAPKQILASAVALLADGDVLNIKRGTVIETEQDFGGLNITVKPYGAGKSPKFTARAPLASVTSVSGIVYSATVQMVGDGVADRGYFGVFYGDQRLRELDASDGATDQAAAVALIQANPGTFWPATYTEASPWDDGDTITYYFSLPDSSDATAATDPITAYKRENVFQNLHGEVHGMVLECGWAHNGIENVRMVECDVLHPASHGNLIIQSHEKTRVIGGNPKASGGKFHSFSATLTDDLVWEGLTAVDEFLPGRGTAFFSHGSSGVKMRDTHHLIDCTAINSGIVASFEQVDHLIAYNLTARNALTLTGAEGGAEVSVTIVNCDVRGSKKLTGETTQRFIRMATDGKYNISHSVVDSAGQELMYAGAAVGSIDIDHSTMILRAEDIDVGNAQMILVNNAALGTLSIKNSYLICDAASRLRYVARVGSVTTVDIDETLVVGTYDNSMEIRVGSTDTPLADVNQAGNRVLSIGFSRVVDTDDENGLTFKLGTWTPGMHIFSDVAYTNDADQPRMTIMVGDVIVKRDFLVDGLLTHTPAGHLNGVIWVKGTADDFFVAVGDQGEILRTTDGETWTSIVAASGSNQDLLAVGSADIVQDDTVIAVGRAGTILRSTDAGATFSPVTSGVAVDILSVASDGAETWIAGTIDGQILRSTNDGASWTAATVGSANYTWNAVYYSHLISKFLIGGKDTNSLESAIRHSTDGAAWTNTDAVSGNTVVDFDEHAEAGAIVAVCYQSSPDDSCILYSGDGATWEASPQSVPFQIRAITGPGNDDAYRNAGFLAVGESQYGAFGRDGRDLFDVRLLTDPENLSRNQEMSVMDYIKGVA